MTAPASIEPLRDPDELRAYIDEYWMSGHVLARDPSMLAFTYATPWVDRTIFPAGLSVLGAYGGDGRLLGFLGAITAPYPRPASYWLALWHVLPELKGTGMGGLLLQRMQEHAAGAGGWIGTFGAGPEALPVYLKRGYLARAVRRWTYDGTDGADQRRLVGDVDDAAPSDAWLRYRYTDHPVFRYEERRGTIFRTEANEWGHVTHVARLGGSHPDEVAAVYERERSRAAADGRPYVLDAWSFDVPGAGWSLADADEPSVFHPPEARGNLIYAVGRPFMPAVVEKGDCDQDRPN